MLITVTVSLAQAGLNWLRAEPPDPFGRNRQALNDIASDGKRAAEIVRSTDATSEKALSVSDGLWILRQ